MGDDQPINFPPEIPVNGLPSSAMTRMQQSLREDVENGDDIEEIFQESITLIEHTQVGHPNRKQALEFIANCTANFARTNRDLYFLDGAIRARLDLFSELPRRHPRLPRVLKDLGDDFLLRHQLSGLSRDIESSIRAFEDALSTAISLNLNPAPYFSFLGDAYVDKYQSGGTINDLDLGIEKHQASLDAVTHDVQQRGIPLRALGEALLSRYAACLVPEYLRRSQVIYQELIEGGMEDSDEDRAKTLSWFGEVLYSISIHHLRGRDGEPQLQDAYHWDQAAQEDALNKAIDVLRKSVGMTPFNHVSRKRRVIVLGEALASRYAIAESLTDAQSAVTAIEEGTALMEEGSYERTMLNERLWKLHTEIFRESQSFNHLGLAIQSYETFTKVAIHSSSLNDWELGSIGDLYMRRFLEHRNMRDLEQSIVLLERGLSLDSSDATIRQRLLVNVAGVYLLRFEQIGAASDAESAIQASIEGLGLPSESGTSKATLLMHLGVAYESRYKHTHSIQDEDLAVEKLQEALALLSSSDKLRAEITANLVNIRTRKCGFGAWDSDLNDLIDSLQETLPAVKEHEQPRLRCTIASALLAKWVKLNDRDDLQQALGTLSTALAQTPLEHPLRPQLLSLFVKCTSASSEAATSVEWDLIQEIMDHPSSSPAIKLEFGQKLMLRYRSEQSSTLAYKTASQVVSCIPLLVPQSLENSDRQALLKNARGLASDGAALSLFPDVTESNLYDTIRLLELGRGLIQTSLNILRAEISDLRTKHVHLAEQYVKLRGQLDSASFGGVASLEEPTAKVWDPNQASARHNAGQSFEQLLLEIRQQDGFDRFLLGPSEDEIKAAAGEIPIVVLNVSVYRCDALIIQRDQIQSLWLPRLRLSDIKAHAKSLDANVSASLLEWLWKVVAKPVLRVLGFDQAPSPGDPWPCICWIPTGLLAKFPIHAAGLHTEGDFTNSVLDRAISTYSTSVWALVEARSHQEKSPMPKPRTGVFVGMKHDLQFVEEEETKVVEIWDQANLQVLQPDPGRSDVLEAVETCDIFHFAGHGKTDLLDPSQSALTLADEPLTVDSLQKTNLRDRRPFLAYLSACGTGQNKVDELVDESIHLMAACQLAGFQSVIGSLWQVDDKSSVDVAVDTYDWIRRFGMTSASVAEGLHHACRALRRKWILATERSLKKKAMVDTRGERPAHAVIEKHEGNPPAGHPPLHWVPFVLYGC